MDMLESVEDMSFAPTEGRKPERGELCLQFAQVVTAENKIVGEIAGAAQMLGMDGERPPKERGLKAEHFSGKTAQGLGNTGEAFSFGFSEVGM